MPESSESPDSRVYWTRESDTALLIGLIRRIGKEIITKNDWEAVFEELKPIGAFSCHQAFSCRLEAFKLQTLKHEHIIRIKAGDTFDRRRASQGSSSDPPQSPPENTESDSDEGDSDSDTATGTEFPGRSVSVSTGIERETRGSRYQLAPAQLEPRDMPGPCRVVKQRSTRQEINFPISPLQINNNNKKKKNRRKKRDQDNRVQVQPQGRNRNQAQGSWAQGARGRNGREQTGATREATMSGALPRHSPQGVQCQQRVGSQQQRGFAKTADSGKLRDAANTIAAVAEVLSKHFKH